MELYRLEFNEKQQLFHLDNYTHKANTYGWFTLSDHCTDLEFHIFEAYVNRIKIDKLTKEYLIKSLDEVAKFIENISEYGLIIES